MSVILRRLYLQNVIRNSRKYADYRVPANFKYPTMDDLPVPQGSWQAQYDATQSKYNKQLIFGTGFFIVSLIVFKTSGLVYFHWSPPPLPGKEQ